VTKKRNENEQEALKYHSENRPGKIEVVATKPCITSQDLSLAYSPGVAWPCLEISKDPKAAYDYTAKGNLVGVISNGSAVLGLGNIGPLAGKPVMEGKGILFKRFADIDVFDIEINETTVEGMVRTIAALEPTFGGINLEDIKAPECFEVERQLIEKLNIPVFHDDQHGTAIIATAAFINALEITKRKIANVKVVFSGAGAASIACARLFINTGIKPENLIMCDSKGVIYKGREAGMNIYKEEFAIDTKLRTLADAMKKADAFIGCSARGVLTKEMVKTMAKNPIIFAMANPEPEIYPDEVAEVRSDAIMATGRSDFPNQVNNVLGFPFIFRGALDVRAKKINMEMKLAAVKALSELAKEKVPNEVKLAYGNVDFEFGREYLIPKPFDTRALTRVASAVAKAAIDSGVAELEITDFTEYARSLEDRLGVSASFMKSLRDRRKAYLNKSKDQLRMVFAEGGNTRILNAVSILLEEGKVTPILLGSKTAIHKKMDKIGLPHLKEVEIVTPEKHDKFSEFYFKFSKERERKGIGLSLAQELMGQENYFGGMMIREGLGDILISGPKLNYPQCFDPIMKIIGTENNSLAAGIFILVFKDKVLFLSDCTAQIDPSEEDLSDIANGTADLYKKLMKRDPRIAFLSFSNFGSNNHPKAKKIKNAVELTKKKYPDLIVDGEIQSDVAVNKNIIKQLCDFCEFEEAADVLIFPDLNASNIAYKLISQLADCTAIGPILVPMNAAVNIIQRTATVSEIIDICNLTTLLHFEKNDKGEKNGI
jgi:malate dehydrogenase (oxaloacetate-decarboxylating)(NADP+)